MSRPTEAARRPGALAAAGRVVDLAAIVVGSLAIVALLVTVVADVVLRGAFSTSIPGTVEYVRYWWMVPASLLGIYLAQRSDEHIEMPLLIDRMAPASRLVTHVVSGVLVMVVLGFLAVVGWEHAWGQMAISEYHGAVTVWPLRFLVPVAFALTIVAVGLRLFAPPPLAEESALLKEEIL